MEYVKKKLESSYSNLLKKAIKLISYKPENVILYGSGALKASIFAGDVDLLEEIEIKAKTKDEASKKLVKIIQNIYKKIYNSDMAKVTDIKTGYYTDYYEILEQLGEIKDNKIVGYNPKEIKKLIKKIYPNKEINNEYQNILSEKQMLDLVYDKPTFEQFLDLQEQIRQDATIRWDNEDLLNGYTTWVDLIDNKEIESKLYMWKAILRHKAPIKIDMIYPFPHRLVEVTNFIVFIWIDENGRKHNINTEPFNSENFVISLKDQVNKLVNSESKNYLKAVKRISAIMRQQKDEKGLNKIMPILESNCGLLYQILGDIKTLILFLENSDRFTDDHKNYILNEIDLFKQRLANIYEFN